MKVYINVTKTTDRLEMVCPFFIFKFSCENEKITNHFYRNRTTNDFYKYNLNPSFGNWLSSFFGNKDVVDVIPDGEYSFIVDGETSNSGFRQTVKIQKPITSNIFFVSHETNLVYWFAIKSYIERPRGIRFVAWDKTDCLPENICFESKMNLYFAKYIKDGRVVFKMFGQYYGVNDFYFTFGTNDKKKLCISFGVDNFLSIDVDDIKSIQNSFYLNTGELVI